MQILQALIRCLLRPNQEAMNKNSPIHVNQGAASAWFQRMAFLPATALAALALALTGCESVQTGAGALADAVERGVLGGAFEGFTGQPVNPNASLDEIKQRWRDVAA